MPNSFKTAVPYILPFALFALLTLLATWLGEYKEFAYPLKTLLTAGLLFFLLPGIYKREIKISWDWLAIISGIFVFLVWVLLEGWYFQLGSSSAFNPYEISNNLAPSTIIFFRLLGTALIVPIVEELFWRSFALRYLIDSKFDKVPLGKFTWFSFIAVSIAFGFEHHRWLPGIIAGMVYALLLYKRKNLFSPILSHFVTNLALGIYVIYTASWEFW